MRCRGHWHTCDMMRGVLLVPLAVIFLRLTGCAVAILAPGDERDGRVAMAFEEFGFRTDFARSMSVCASMSGTHPHGFFILAGIDFSGCDAAREARPREQRWIAFWADHNATEYRTLGEAHCVPIVPADKAVMLVLNKWRAQGIVAAQCDTEGGRLELELTALSAARFPTTDGDLPRFLYRFQMSSTAEHHAEEQADFVKMIEHVRFSDPA